MKQLEKKYLARLSELYPTIAEASTELINLQAILSLPKGTEHFLSDIHGEYEAFSHVLKNGSGSVRRKIEEIFGKTLSNSDKRSLATLIYYPKEKIDRVSKELDNMEEWYKITLYRLVTVSRNVGSKYTRSKVRKAMPKEFAYIIDELINESSEIGDKESYYDAIIDTMVRIGRAREFIIALCELIQRLVVDHLHIVGDIFDRGPGSHIVMDKLMEYHSVDVQWGNHDVLWMGAAAGQKACIANVIRICARYANLDILEDGYGINLLPLASFAHNMYRAEECGCFKINRKVSYNSAEMDLDIEMHKAISIIQFKLEGQIINENPEFGLEHRNLLHLIDFEKGTICIDGKDYQLQDTFFPTINPKDPYALSEQEADIMDRLQQAFLHCEKMQTHMRFLINKGSLYKIHNGNLLYHGCIPLNTDGSFKTVRIYGKEYQGKELYKVLESYVRKGFFALDPAERERGKDIMWYIWLSPDSPLFGKDRMATFERYFLTEKELHNEKKNPYFMMLEEEEVIDRILKEFGLEGEEAHIVNGHVPVKYKDGESPIKCNGKVVVIDGGFSKAFQKQTGIAGYTLIYNSYGLILAAHESFESMEAAIENESDIFSQSTVVKRVLKRKRVEDTDTGKVLSERVSDLEKLLAAYRDGIITEKM